MDESEANTKTLIQKIAESQKDNENLRAEIERLKKALSASETNRTKVEQEFAQFKSTVK